LYGVQDETSVAPESYTLDWALLARPGNDETQLDLFLDYASNIALYPKFQEYFRAKKPPLLAVWGKNDPFFDRQARRPSGVMIQIPKFTSTIPDTSHSNTHVQQIANTIGDFLIFLFPFPDFCPGYP